MKNRYMYETYNDKARQLEKDRKNRLKAFWLNVAFWLLFGFIFITIGMR